ncbi:glycine C-acetyltransferase [bacterium]|nr:glycine C-acetyltransferase [bacterium]
MYSPEIRESYSATLREIQDSGLYKNERIIRSPQSSEISVAPEGDSVLNFCANNYLGLADSRELIEAAKEGLERYGFGLSSVRFICGTQEIHKELERRVSDFHGMDDAILYAACFDANGGLFEPLLGADDAVVSDALNHASIIDGIRLCKAQRYRYLHSDLGDLERCLQEAKSAGAQKILVATDGVFSMDGEVADLQGVCDLAERYGAMVMVDECHATGFFGENGKGSVEHCGVLGRVDIVTSTLGKALGGAIGGFTTGPKEVIDLLRQRSRPYLFSNSLPPAIVSAGIACLGMIEGGAAARTRLRENTRLFRDSLQKLGFQLKGDVHPIVPVMLGDAKLAAAMAEDLLGEGIYVVGFSYPVVPKGEARIRVQLSAGHAREEIERAIAAFERVGRKHGVIPAS